MERQSKGSRGLEAYCKGGQGPPRAVVPPKRRESVHAVDRYNHIHESHKHNVRRSTDFRTFTLGGTGSYHGFSTVTISND